MKKISSPIVLVLCFMLGACSAILGESEPGDELIPPPGASYPDELSIEGTPNQSLPTTEGGYFLWKNRNTFTVRIVRPGVTPLHLPAPVFAGSIRVTGGLVKGIKKQNIVFPNDIRSTIGEIDYRIELKESVSGFDFEIQPIGVEYCVLFDLRYDGASVPELVHLGRSQRLPGALPLNICFH